MALLDGDPNKPKNPPKHWIFNEIGSIANKTLGGVSVRDTFLAAAKEGNVDPATLFGSATVEGFNKVAARGKNQYSQAYDNAAAGYSEYIDEKTGKVLKARAAQNKLDTKTFTVDGFEDYGLDTFGNKYNQLKKYLPAGFEKNFQTYDAYNEKQEKVKTAAFRTNKDALIAKAALLNYEKDRVNAYAKQKGLSNLDQRTVDYFTLASYNHGNANKIIDEYAASNDKANFIDKGLTTQTAIHNNIYPRIAVRAEAQKALGIMAYGGKMPKKPKKYDDGGEIDPITGKPKVQIDDPAAKTNQLGSNGTDAFSYTKGQNPINPDVPAEQQIFALQPEQGDPVEQGKIIPIDQIAADKLSAQNYEEAQRQQATGDNIEKGAMVGITAINEYFNKKEAAQQNRKNRRAAIMQEIDGQLLNPYSEGTGSQAIFGSGGSIHIKPENRGKFTAAAKKAGKGVQAYAAQILAHKENYSPTLVKRANFARNAAKWHEDGGEMEGADQGIQILDGGKAKNLSNSVHSNPMMEFTGKEHSEGGIGLAYGGQVGEVENKEVGWVDKAGSLNIFGKLKMPGTNMTFKTVAKNLAEEENKVDGMLSKYTNIINNGDPSDPYQESAHSTAKVMFKSLDRQAKKIDQKKEGLASYQNLILSMTEKGDKMAYGGKMPREQYAKGGELTPEELQRLLDALGKTESSGYYKARGPVVQSGQYKGERALGKYQIMPGNLKAWSKEALGREVTEQEFLDNPDLQDQIAAHRIKQINKTYKDAKDIASIWHSGKPLAGNTAADVNMKTTDYVKKVISTYDENITEQDVIGAAPSYLAPKEKARVTPVQVGIPEGFSYTNINNDGTPAQNPNADGKGLVNTPYGPAKKDPAPFSEKAEIIGGNRVRGDQSPLYAEQIAPELLTMATNRRKNVEQLTYQPELKQTFDQSYQLGRNENQATFNATARIAEAIGSVEALGTLAAQKYKADEAYNMQEVQGNAAQKLQVYGQNIDTLNDAKLKNLALIADQQNKQEAADFNTRKEFIAPFTSIESKVLQNKLENKTYNAYANLFQHYGFDEKGNVTFDPDKVKTKFTPGQAQQFGFLSATQGAEAIMNGDFSRQFKKVKNADGSQTTTETLGRNKKIQEEYNALKAQGFGDDIIGNMLRAKFPETITQD